MMRMKPMTLLAGCAMAALAWVPACPAVSGAPAESGHHHAAHGGCLNAIGACEIGHAEVRLEGSELQLWFVGGGADTLRAVRVPDRVVELTLRLPAGGEPRHLTLDAKPLELAGETVGDCSHFMGAAVWLRDVHAFEAVGEVTFKGQKSVVKICYPAGYDPDDDAAPVPPKGTPAQ